jgi:hypothetical protein
MHLTNENDNHIGYTDFMETLERCHEFGEIIVQDKQGCNYKIHSIQQDEKHNTILVIEPEYNQEDSDYEE